MDKIKEKMWGAILGFFCGSLLIYVAVRVLMQIWLILLFIAIIALGIIIFLRIKKGKPPKY